MIFDFMKKSDIDFIDADNSVAHIPELAIKRARDVEPFFKQHQKEKYGEYKFPACPGMLDFSRIGYIIPAWGPLKIKANSAGVATLNTPPAELKTHKNIAFMPGLRFDEDVIDGLFQPQDNVRLSVFNFPGPWRIRCRKGLSMIVMPPYYHFRHLDSLHIIPGVVDYSTGFQTVNFIAAVKKETEVHIEAGEPLIQVIPIPTAAITATYGKEHDYKNKSIDNSDSTLKSYRQWYSKYLKLNKKFNLINRNKEKYEIFD